MDTYTPAKDALLKLASRAKEEVDERKNDSYGAAEKALREFNEAPSKKTLNELADAIEKADAMHPTHIQGGLYSETRDAASRAREMMGRGNYIRGLLGWGLGVPASAIYDTLSIPSTTAARSLSPTINTRFKAPDEVRDMDVGDRSAVKATARELLDLIGEDRPDPTSYFENVNNLKRKLRARTAQTVGKLVDEKMKADADGKEYGLFSPYAAALTQDIVSMPHTALMNLIGLNGAPRYKYEGKKQEAYLNKEANAATVAGKTISILQDAIG